MDEEFWYDPDEETIEDPDGMYWDYFRDSATCHECESINVTPTGRIKKDEYGVYVQLKCNECGRDTEDGDGELFDYYNVNEATGEIASRKHIPFIDGMREPND